ncbi:MAG: hypothetical protein Q4P20_09980 [Eubacteriales bacterium]|nr:hypothetical protein [Eubacteriales bacterium]
MIDTIYDTAIQLAPSADKGVLRVAVLKVEQMICNYCNVDTVPEGLYYVAADMAVDAWNRIRLGNAGTDAGSAAEVKSVTRGDTSYTFATQTESLKDVLSASGFLNDWKTQLNQFRRMR